MPCDLLGAGALQVQAFRAEDSHAYDKVVEHAILKEIREHTGLIVFNTRVSDGLGLKCEQNLTRHKLAMQTHRRLLALIGNPGNGKSTLLNGIIGQILFGSGPSIGTGLTQSMLDFQMANCRQNRRDIFHLT
jgi:predicted GTPase